ncbi:MAG: nucleotidyl transferase AbiEii/AbiGii toxin family protein [Pseudomonadales bacterium]
MPDLKRNRHQLVWSVLKALNAPLLLDLKCYFGGGTRIVLELNEYRESMDVDFLCSDRTGYRELRGMISQSSFGDIFKGDYQLMRDIRADMYGIRTFLLVDGQPLKIEIISEGRIELGGSQMKPFPLAVLDHSSCIAEKFMANTDRGRDKSTQSRDLVDLAFMAASWPEREMFTGLSAAQEAYGHTVYRELNESLNRLEHSAYRQQCVAELRVKDTRKLGRGLATLSRVFDRSG